MKWLLTSPMVAFDTETTGVNVECDRIVTAAVITLQPKVAGQPWQVHTQTWLLDPGVDIPAEATAIHGITTEHAREHGTDPTIKLDFIATKLAGQLASRWTGDGPNPDYDSPTDWWPLVGFNLAYDLTMLDRELRRHRLLPLDMRLGRPVAPCIDPYVLDKQIDPYRRGSRKLTDLCRHYGVTLDTAHNAAADALAAARLAYRIAQLATRAGAGPVPTISCPAVDRAAESPFVLEALTELATLGKTELHQAQVGWRAEQMASLADYFRTKGQSADDMDGQWPQRAWKEPDQ